MEEHQTYKSVHAYMDALFKDRAPTEKEIIESKQAYRKYYLKNYQKSYKQKYVQITFRISKQQYQEFEKAAAHQKIKVTTLVKQRALQTSQRSTKKLKVLLFELMDYIEEIVYENQKPDLVKLTKKLEQIERELL